MKVEYVDHMGTDLTVCNAARVSFAKASEWSHVSWSCDFSSMDWHDDVCPQCGTDNYGRRPGDGMELAERDVKLIRYLVVHVPAGDLVPHTTDLVLDELPRHEDGRLHAQLDRGVRERAPVVVLGEVTDQLDVPFRQLHPVTRPPAVVVRATLGADIVVPVHRGEVAAPAHVGPLARLRKADTGGVTDS